MNGHMSAKKARIDGGDGPSEAEILALVAKREAARQVRNFAESDAVRDMLRSMGVELYDKEKVWRARDGRRGMLFTAGPNECNLTNEEIQERIQQREDARSAKDWDRADVLRNDLRDLGVELDDKASMWRTSSGRSGTYNGMPLYGSTSSGYASSTSIVGHSGHGQRVDPAMVSRLVADRERCRSQHDYDSADEIRRQLVGLGVEIFDNERTWRSADGQSGLIVTGGHQGTVFLSNQEIYQRVCQREEARQRKDFVHADSIRDDLRQQGVELLDQHKVWSTSDGRQGNFNSPLVTHYGNPSTAHAAPRALAPAAMAASGMSFSTASIIALVHGRERMREQHNWEAADAIRHDLKSHGVEVWDKDKAWRCNDGRSGVIPRG